MVSADHSGCPDCHTLPARPTPAPRTDLRFPAMNCSSVGSGRLQNSLKRNTPAGSSTCRYRPHSQPSDSQMARITDFIAEETLSDSARLRVTVCSSFSSSSERLFAVTSWNTEISYSPRPSTPRMSDTVSQIHTVEPSL